MLNYEELSTKELDIHFDLLLALVNQYGPLTANPENKGSEKHKSDTFKFGYALQEMKKITDVLKSRQQTQLIFSIEELYELGGQFDNFLIYSFYKTSDAFKKYGSYACGVILYRKGEREALDAVLQDKNRPRSDGKLLIRGGCEKGNNTELESDGFLLSEVFEIGQTSSASKQRNYKSTGTKTIPNSIPINFDLRKVNALDLRRYSLSMYSREGYALKRHDQLFLHCYQFVIDPAKLERQVITEFLQNPHGELTEEAKYQILEIKVASNRASDEEKEEFRKLMFRRNDLRLQFVAEHYGLGKNGIEKIRKTHFKRYMALAAAAVMFETETLANISKTSSVYWDWDRYIHIYSRHYPDFEIPTSTKGKGTPFQYAMKDVRRLAIIIIQQLREEIDATLQSGQSYERKAYYYNGNHYSIQIASDGRLMAFHPRD